MKKIISLSTLIVFILSFIFLSCNKEKEEIYSCNPEAQNYAVMNKMLNQDISRDSLSKLPLEQQMAVFRSLTNYNKLRIFKEKIDLVLASVEELTSEERDALIMLRDEVPEDIYGRDGDTHPFLLEWENMVRNDLGWNDTAMEVYVGTWNTPSEIMSRFTSPANAGGVSDCTCTVRIGCAGFGYCDKLSSCDNTNDGCGFMGKGKCTGSCPETTGPDNGGSRIYLSSKYDF